MTTLLADMADDLIQVSGFKATVSNLGFRSNRNDRTGAYIKSWASPDLLGSYLRGDSPGINVAAARTDILIAGTLMGPAAGFANTRTSGIDFGDEVTRCAVTGCSLSNHQKGATNSTPPGSALSANV